MCRALLLLVPLLSASPLRADFRAGMEAYERGDYEAALREWRPLAEAGMAEAQYNVGLIHARGKGVAADAARAHEWFLKAAEGGFARAQYRVAEMFEVGEGVRTDPIRAHYWFRRAALQKHADAKKRSKRVAKTMTPEQIAYAELLLRQWKRRRKSPE